MQEKNRMIMYKGVEDALIDGQVCVYVCVYACAQRPACPEAVLRYAIFQI